MPEGNGEVARRYFEEVIDLRHFEVCGQIIAEEYEEHAEAPFG